MRVVGPAGLARAARPAGARRAARRRRAPPASPAAGWIQRLRNGPSRRIRPLPTQFSATPPARQRLLAARLAVERAGQAEHHLLGDLLDRARQVHLPLGQLRLRLARRAAEQRRRSLRVRHREPGAVVEVLHVQPEGAVRLEVEQVVVDGLHVLRPPVGRQPHHLVLARVDLEAGVVGERRVEQAERVREGDLPERRQLAALAEPGRASWPTRRRRPCTAPPPCRTATDRSADAAWDSWCSPKRSGGSVALCHPSSSASSSRCSRRLQEQLLVQPDRHRLEEGAGCRAGRRPGRSPAGART